MMIIIIILAIGIIFLSRCKVRDKFSTVQVFTGAYKTTTPWSDFGTIVALLDVLCEDVNGDGVVNGTDIQEVINIIVNAE